jgi:hypothetical protein
MFRGDRYGTRVPNEQEWRVIKFVAQGLKNSEIADALGTTRYVIANYLRAIYDKLGLWNRVELALCRLQPGYNVSVCTLGSERKQRPKDRRGHAGSGNYRFGLAY